MHNAGNCLECNKHTSSFAPTKHCNQRITYNLRERAIIRKELQLCSICFGIFSRKIIGKEWLENMRGRASEQKRLGETKAIRDGELPHAGMHKLHKTSEERDIPVTDEQPRARIR